MNLNPIRPKLRGLHMLVRPDAPWSNHASSEALFRRVYREGSKSPSTLDLSEGGRRLRRYGFRASITSISPVFHGSMPNA
jgi:hypothetical protein